MMAPEFVTRKAFIVVGMKHRAKGLDNPAAEIVPLWDRFAPRMDAIPRRTQADVAYGVMGNWDEATQEWDYLAGVEVEPPPEIPEGMAVWEIPAQTYAVFRCTLATIGETWSYIYEQWLPQSAYARTDGPEFEYYGEDFDPDPANEGSALMYAYIPVQPKV